MTEKEIKQRIRALKKLKKVCGVGSKQRKDLNKQIKDLKETLTGLVIPATPEKEKLIAEILRIETERKSIPTFKQLGIDLNKYTIAELEKHLDLITKKGK